MMKRWATPERPRSLVRATARGKSIEQIADNEGYFDIKIPGIGDKVDTILIELPNSEVSRPAEHSLYEVGEDNQCVIISDIDDTVLITHAAKRLRMIATTLFGNALTRQLFPGSPELYRALRNGPDEQKDQANPITYVTSSPFNLHSLIHLIFEENDLPNGPFFMTDWGLDVDKWFAKSHREHKIEAIETALEWFPEKPVILIGDSGQHDTMIYVDIALAHPHRIDQILIRDVTGPERLSELQGKVDRLKEEGTRFSFFSDSAEAAEILAGRGWISSRQKEGVRDAVENAGRPLFHL
jgi:phosphatidate phosphatase APP1